MNKGNLKFKCVCGKLHAIKSCDGLQSYYYYYDDWKEGKLGIICPKTKTVNRIYFKVRSEIPWEYQLNYEYNPEAQFKINYTHYFKSILTDLEGQNEYKWVKNTYFDNNHKKFGIKVAKYREPKPINN